MMIALIAVIVSASLCSAGYVSFAIWRAVFGRDWADDFIVCRH